MPKKRKGSVVSLPWQKLNEGALPNEQLRSFGTLTVSIAGIMAGMLYLWGWGRIKEAETTQLLPNT